MSAIGIALAGANPGLAPLAAVRGFGGGGGGYGGGGGGDREPGKNWPTWLAVLVISAIVGLGIAAIVWAVSS